MGEPHTGAAAPQGSKVKNEKDYGYPLKITGLSSKIGP